MANKLQHSKQRVRLPSWLSLQPLLDHTRKQTVLVVVVSEGATWTWGMLALRSGLCFGSGRLSPSVMVPSSWQPASLQSDMSSSLPLNVHAIQLVALASLQCAGLWARLPAQVPSWSLHLSGWLSQRKEPWHYLPCLGFLMCLWIYCHQSNSLDV